MKIIFKNEDNSIVLLSPTEEVLNYFSLEEIAEKDVPAPYKYPTKYGLDENDVLEWGEYATPYWIVEDDVIPTDRTFRNAWEVDESLGLPDGWGGENNEFDSELVAKYLKDVNDSN